MCLFALQVVVLRCSISLALLPYCLCLCACRRASLPTCRRASHLRGSVGLALLPVIVVFSAYAAEPVTCVVALAWLCYHIVFVSAHAAEPVTSVQKK